MSSLYFQILNFYSFLQFWGMQDVSVDKNQKLLYKYNLAFNNQKQLQDEISQLLQALNNIKIFLLSPNCSLTE